ncbi:MAG: sugar ABC transporter permease [Tabrizicola sp.]|nr:sugar ABC transporter permease [Tabrizicola sp.]HMS96484.1 sugar ABC transporter permease [Tabrizicola sp.]
MRLSSRITSRLVISPFVLVAVFTFVLCVLWSAQLSFTSSKIFPAYDYVGFKQYARLFANERWILSFQNMLIFGACLISGALVIGFLLAVMIDQSVKWESFWRTVFLYPNALSFVVTGLAWQWLLNPSLGLPELVRHLGWSDFQLNLLGEEKTALYAVSIAAVWQASGLVMALCLAGLRGIDGEIWKATRIDGVPRWKTYLHIVIPMLGPIFFTAIVLLSLSVVKGFDLVVAMTNGGPGTATEVPAKFVIDHIQIRANVGLAMAGATVMLISVVAALAPWVYVQKRRKEARG